MPGMEFVSTIVILDLVIVVVRVLYWLVQASMDEDATPFHITFALAFGFLLFTFCKDYLKEYVDLSKI